MKGRSGKPCRKGREYRLQANVARWLFAALGDAAGVWWTSIDLGFTGRRATFFRKYRGCQPGTPDMAFFRNGRAYFVELKVSAVEGRKGTLTPAQKRVHERLRAAGSRVGVAYSGQDVEMLLRRWRFPLACPFGEHFPIPDEWKSRPWRRLRVRPMTPAERARLNKARRELAALPPLAELKAAEAAGPAAVKALWARVRAEATGEVA